MRRYEGTRVEPESGGQWSWKRFNAISWDGAALIRSPVFEVSAELRRQRLAVNLAVNTLVRVWLTSADVASDLRF